MTTGTCLICGNAGTVSWTINDGRKAGVADLCVEHGKPLREILDATSKLPPSGSSEARKAASYPRRKLSFEPLEWTPPAAD